MRVFPVPEYDLPLLWAENKKDRAARSFRFSLYSYFISLKRENYRGSNAGIDPSNE
jgi:hypothetical protein